MTDKNRSLAQLLNSTSKTVFTTQDFNKLWQYQNYRSLVQRISYLKRRNKIIQIKRGLYSITGRQINELELANKLRTPSYLSFQTALFKNGVIFQWDQTITLAGRESIKLKVLDYKIVFRQLKKEILLKTDGIEREGHYFIASKERAILDMLYLNPNFSFDNLRSVNFDRLKELAKIYQRQKINKLIKKMEKNA